ncbi:MAG: DsbE family thiol:disulfide interchange protein [Gammaproteobacteria bacterium]|nr:DsbE family thiol:disulfide interchange protein [Gammaproteobacteria bacterium]MDX2486787.1 DsbE family thiol:disulfide interchange protein [Gammaproteobacteria bacterium]
MKRYLLPLAGFIVLVVFLAIGLKLDPKHIPSPFIGKPAPAFDLPDLHNPQQRIKTADLKGQVWLLNVWASWCVSCRAEHEVVKRFVAMNETPVFGLNYKDKPEDGKAWLGALGNPYETSLMDISGDVGIDWGVYGVPETFVIDKKGIVRYKQVGPLTDSIIDEKIIPLVRELDTEAS